MTPSEVIKTNSIAKVGVLVGQMIKGIKTFRNLGNVMSISMLEHFDDIILVLSAKCNFKKTYT